MRHVNHDVPISGSVWRLDADGKRRKIAREAIAQSPAGYAVGGGRDRIRAK
jgi:hypothetical protein